MYVTEERDLELEFQEKTKVAKARHKEIKALGQLMAAVAAQTSTHAKVGRVIYVADLDILKEVFACCVLSYTRNAETFPLPSPHVQALEKVSNSAELQAHQIRKDQVSTGGAGGASGGPNGGGTRSSLTGTSETWWSTLASLLLQVSGDATDSKGRGALLLTLPGGCCVCLCRRWRMSRSGSRTPSPCL